MSSITRKNKRRVAFKCAKQGIAPAQAIAASAARETVIRCSGEKSVKFHEDHSLVFFTPKLGRYD
ncbi:hypothetical protein [Phascolarctobacterium succinatutens]|uniref:hypothetical protein n=1 Tax=Phascolarctobacterium succinatutens TaxID=626940 RepID=UPI003AEF4AFC